jgi:hypothetical protein
VKVREVYNILTARQFVTLWVLCGTDT